MKPFIQRILILFAMLQVSACSSNIPELIRHVPEGDVQPAEVQGDAQRFVGTQVRWGGTIAQTQNREEFTEVEVVSRALDSDGEPVSGDSSRGRFIARIDGFLDPLIYAEKRNITVSGRVAGAVERNIGERSYIFPVVEVKVHYLWPERKPQQCYHCDPYLDPWWPYRPYWPYGPYY